MNAVEKEVKCSESACEETSPPPTVILEIEKESSEQSMK